jgi:hypothetical protein
MAGAVGHPGLASALTGAAGQGSLAFARMGAAFRHASDGPAVSAKAYADTEQGLAARAMAILRELR